MNEHILLFDHGRLCSGVSGISIVGSHVLMSSEPSTLVCPDAAVGPLPKADRLSSVSFFEAKGACRPKTEELLLIGVSALAGFADEMFAGEKGMAEVAVKL